MVWADYLALLSWQGCKILLRDFQSLKAACPNSTEDFKHIVSHPETKQFLIYNKYWWKKAEEDHKACSRKEYQLTWPGKKDYPVSFLRLNEPPVSLTYLGDLPRLEKEKYFPLTMVGSRKSHEIVLNWMDFYLPKIIRTKKICLVSGGARGGGSKGSFHSHPTKLSYGMFSAIRAGLLLSCRSVVFQKKPPKPRRGFYQLFPSGSSNEKVFFSY